MPAQSKLLNNEDISKDIITIDISRSDFETKKEWQQMWQRVAYLHIIRIKEKSNTALIQLDANMGSGKGHLVKDLTYSKNVICISISDPRRHDDTISKIKADPNFIKGENHKLDDCHKIMKIDDYYINNKTNNKIYFSRLTDKDNTTEFWTEVALSKLSDEDPFIVLDEADKFGTRFGFRHYIDKGTWGKGGDFFNYMSKNIITPLDIILSTFSVLNMSGTLGLIIREESIGHFHPSVYVAPIIVRMPDEFIPKQTRLFIPKREGPISDYILNLEQYDIETQLNEHGFSFESLIVDDKQIMFFDRNSECLEERYKYLKMRYPEALIYKYRSGDVDNEIEKKRAHICLFLASNGEGYDNPRVIGTINLRPDNGWEIPITGGMSTRESQKNGRIRGSGGFIINYEEKRYRIVEDDRLRREGRILDDPIFWKNRMGMNNVVEKIKANIGEFVFDPFKIYKGSQSFIMNQFIIKIVQGLFGMLTFGEQPGAKADNNDFPSLNKVFYNKYGYFKREYGLVELQTFISTPMLVNDSIIDNMYGLCKYIFNYQVLEDYKYEYDDHNLNVKLFNKKRKINSNMKYYNNDIYIIEQLYSGKSSTSYLEKRIFVPDGYNPDANPEIKNLFNKTIIPSIIEFLLKIQPSVNLDVCDYEINSCKTIIQTRPDLLEKLGLTIIECDSKSYEIQSRLIKENGYNINIENGDILSICSRPKDNRLVYADTCGSSSGFDYHIKLLEQCKAPIIVGTFTHKITDNTSVFERHVKERKTMCKQYGSGKQMSTYISIDKPTYKIIKRLVLELYEYIDEDDDYRDIIEAMFSGYKEI